MRTGEILDGRFELREVLGEGGMGQVFKAWDKELERYVAVKSMLPQFSSDPSSMSEMKREVRLSQSLHHPNIVAVYDYRVHERTPFIVMEFVLGQPLNYYLYAQPQQRLPESTFRALAEQILAGIEYAHATGVVHRDLKPANLMVMPDGRLKIMDFGIAAAIKATYTKLTGHSSGLTIQYSSPEQINGENPSPSMDIYSLGCVFYEMLCGHPPFYQGEILYQQMNRTPDPLPGVSVVLSGAVMACLAKDARHRPQSAAEVRVLLAGAQTVRLRPAPLRKPAVKQEPGSRRSRGVRVRIAPKIDLRGIVARHVQKAIIGGAVILAIVAGVWLWQSFEKNREQQVMDLRATIVQAIGQGDWAAAEKDVTALLSLTPQDPSAIRWREQVQDAKKTARVAQLGQTIVAAIGARQWDDAKAKLQEFEQLAPGQPEASKWGDAIRTALAFEKQVGDLRGAVSSAIQKRDWGAAEQGVTTLVKLAPQDTQALEWQKLMREGRKEEMVAAEKKQHEDRIADLRKTIPPLLKTRQWDGADRPIQELLTLAPSDPQVLKWRQQSNEGRQADNLGAAKAERERQAAAEVAQRERRIADLQSQIPRALDGRRWSEAVDAIQSLVWLRPDQPQIPMWRQRVLDGHKEDQLAAERADRELRITGLLAEAARSQASRRWEDARSAVRRLAEIDSNDSRVQQSKRQLDQAVHDRITELPAIGDRAVASEQWQTVEETAAEMEGFAPDQPKLSIWREALRRASVAVQSWRVHVLTGDCVGDLRLSVGYIELSAPCRSFRWDFPSVKEVVVGWDEIDIERSDGEERVKLKGIDAKDKNIVIQIQRVMFKKVSRQ